MSLLRNKSVGILEAVSVEFFWELEIHGVWRGELSGHIVSVHCTLSTFACTVFCTGPFHKGRVFESGQFGRAFKKLFGMVFGPSIPNNFLKIIFVYFYWDF